MHHIAEEITSHDQVGDWLVTLTRALPLLAPDCITH